jgi:hypothetical protein
MMKKLLLLSLIALLSVTVSAQKRVRVKSEFMKKTKVVEHKQVRDVVSPIEQFTAAPKTLVPHPYKNSRFTELEVMQTKYDLQSNKGVSNRLYAWPDGTLAAVECMGFQEPGYGDRGTGYNYFDGTQWGPIPAGRIEDEWSGWPTITAWGENGEINVAHLNEGMGVSVRPNKGQGEWDYYVHYGPEGIPWPSWARAATSGENNEYFHFFVNSYDPYEGQDAAMLYCRSSDGGVTLDHDYELIDEIGSSYYNNMDADVYAMDARGNTVALVIGSSWMDMVLLKSSDNGESWEKTIIWEHPYPFWDWETTIMDPSDTLWAPDGSISLALDNQEMAHVVFALCHVAHWEAGGTYNLFYMADGIGYWDEYMEPIEEADDPHYTLSPDHLEELGLLVGWSQDVNGNGQLDLYDKDIMIYPSIGLSTMPTISIDNNNVILLAYSSTTEGYDNTIYYYKHIWTRYSPDNGQTWSNFVDLDDDFIHTLDECVYPTLATRAWDAHFNLIYSIDNYPGLADNPSGANHDPTTNTIWHVAFDDVVGIFDTDKNEQHVEQAIVVSPNPCTGSAELTFETEQPATATLEIYDVSGKQIETIRTLKLSQGNNRIALDVSNYQHGIYLVLIRTSGQTLTGKIAVE